MKMQRQFAMFLFVLGLCILPPWSMSQAGGQAASTVASVAAPPLEAQVVPSDVIQPLPVPRLVKFNGIIRDAAGHPRTGVVGLMFSIYPDSQTGSPLWMELQNVTLDAQGRYTVLLGSTKSDGLPLDLFTTGEPRWLGVKVQLPGEIEQARLLLVSVPYALKASDADTLGGKPASAYLLAPEASGTAVTNGTATKTSSAPAPGPKASTANTSGTASFIPMFMDNSGTLGNSALFQNPSGNIGIGYTSPNARLTIASSGQGAVLNATNLLDQDMQILLSPPGAADKHAFFGSSTATNLTLGVSNSEMMRITNSGNIGIGYANPTNARVVIAAPKGGGVLNASNLADQDMFINLSAPGATDKHAFFGPSTATNLTLGVGGTEMMRIAANGNVGIGTSTPGALLEVNGPAKFDGTVTFSSGQTFAGMASLGANTFIGNQTIAGNLSATGVVTGSSYQIGSNTFAWGSVTSYNAFAGYAGNTGMTGIENTGSGYSALGENQTGNSNTAMGYFALGSNTTGYSNTAIGSAVLWTNQGGGYNTGIGSATLELNSSGSYNTASGALALQLNTTGSNNTATGYEALEYNSVASGNVAVGSQALYADTNGAYNTASGAYALKSNVSGSNNTATGYQALFTNTGSQNTATGSGALYSNTSGSNTATGFLAMYYNSTGGANTATGVQSMYYNTGGGNNTSYGYGALLDNSTGSNNTAVGLYALSNNTSTNSNTGLGYETNVTSGVTNATAIGANAYAGQSNSLVLGSIYGVNGASATTAVGIATTTPSRIFTIGQGYGHALADGWDTYSSRRWKTNIHTLHAALGKIEQLRGVSYDLKESGKHEIGVIAEEVGAVVPEVVTYEKNGTDAQGVDYGRLTALLIEATKEQQALIHQQQQEIVRLRAQVKAIQAVLKTNDHSTAIVKTKLHQ